MPAGAPRIRILFLAANPVTTDSLKLTQEVRQIEEQLRESRYRDFLELKSQWAVRPRDLQRALQDVQPQIVHFSGHGSEQEGLYLESPEGISDVVDHASLVELLKILKNNIQLVVLNACETRSLAEGIARHIDCAIGMRGDVGDAAAIEFSAAFYRAIGAGRSVKDAFDLGRSALKLQKVPEDRTPELFQRTGVDPAKVILVRPPGTRMRKRWMAVAVGAVAGFLGIGGTMSALGVRCAGIEAQVAGASTATRGHTSTETVGKVPSAGSLQGGPCLDTGGGPVNTAKSRVPPPVVTRRPSPAPSSTSDGPGRVAETSTRDHDAPARRSSRNENPSAVLLRTNPFIKEAPADGEKSDHP